MKMGKKLTRKEEITAMLDAFMANSYLIPPTHTDYLDFTDMEERYKTYSNTSRDYFNMMKLNEIYNADCLDPIEGMARLPDKSIDLIVTSPPYDNLRSYNGSLNWSENIWKKVISELYRIMKDGGVVVWVVGDATIKGTESGTSFKQALYAKEIGFNLHDTMIYSKGGQGATGSNNGYWQDFEYMFIFTKGKINIFNPIEDRKNKVKPSCKISSQGHRTTSGKTKGKRLIRRKEFGRRFNIWQYHESGTRSEHPAVFPIQLAIDHILSWSNENDTVLDCFMGSGTTAIACMRNNRNYIGWEKDSGYYKIIQDRIEQEKQLQDAKKLNQ